MADLTPGTVFAGFAIERMLGSGGMGSVYVATHPRLPRKVSLKLLHQSLTHDPLTKRMFEREADHAARLDHANIVSVLDRGDENGQLWIAMQYIPGVNAATAIKQGRVDVPLATHITTEIGKALDYAHQNGVLHRDVKPANILLEETASGAFGRIMLADFGIAKAITDSTDRTRTEKLVASLQFAAPEQFGDGNLDRHADIYALGGTLFNLVTGTPPYTGTSLPQLMRSHLHDPVPVPSERRAGLPIGLDSVVAQAMAKDPKDRFHSCSDLARAAVAACTAPLQPRTLLDTGVDRSLPAERPTRAAPAPVSAPPALEPTAPEPPPEQMPEPAPQAAPAPAPRPTAPDSPTTDPVRPEPMTNAPLNPGPQPSYTPPPGRSGGRRWWIIGAVAAAVVAIVVIALLAASLLRSDGSSDASAPSGAQATGAQAAEDGAAGPSTTMVGADGQTYTIAGDLLQKYQTLTPPQKSDLGPPLGAEKTNPDGHYQWFVGGVIITKKGGTPHIVWGEIRRRWNELGGSQGSLGYPTSDEIDLGTSKVSTFERGTVSFEDGRVKVVMK